MTHLDGVLNYLFETGDFEGPSGTREDVRAVVAACERALDRTAKILTAMVKLDLAGWAEVDMPAEIRRAVQAAIVAIMARSAPVVVPGELAAVSVSVKASGV